ncbi:MAG: type VI secretion system protein ImpH [Cellvibrionaceae bacterium]|jgi:type VI secretion system protein ImpH
MPPSSRRKDTSITQQLIEQPHDFSFFQSVRILERAAVFLNQAEQKNNRLLPTYSENPVARFTPPETEALRFHSYQALQFPSSDIFSVQSNKNKSGSTRWDMIVNFLGLTGVMGVLPYHYTELMLQRLKLKDPSMKMFFDLYNHRTISLFYQAGTKYSLPIEYERKKLNPSTNETHDTATHILLSLMGLGTKHITDKLVNPPESLIAYSGLLSNQIRTTTGLQHILQHQFDIPVKLQEFVGQWQELIDDVRTRLVSKTQLKGQNARLGKSAILGSRGWFTQGKIRIILGPLNKVQLQNFSPGKKALKALNELVRLYVGMEIDYDFIIRVNRTDLPDKISLSKEHQPTIGWNTWLSNKPRSDSKNSDTVDIVVSSNRLK